MYPNHQAYVSQAHLCFLPRLLKLFLFSILFSNFATEPTSYVQNMEKKVFHSKIDWWILAIIMFVLTTMTVAEIATPGSAYILTTGYAIMACIFLFGCRYVIQGNLLLVYQFFKPRCFPVSKIIEIKYIENGWSTGPALSRKRLAIKFSDRNILKSSLPLEISPRRRETFVSAILRINPDIRIIK